MLKLKKQHHHGGRNRYRKNLLAKSIARMLNVPFAIVDATVFTEAGYVGEDVESMLTRLLQSRIMMLQLPKEIVYIDEIDKIARKSDNPSIHVMWAEKAYSRVYWNCSKEVKCWCRHKEVANIPNKNSSSKYTEYTVHLWWSIWWYRPHHCP